MCLYAFRARFADQVDKLGRFILAKSTRALYFLLKACRDLLLYACCSSLANLTRWACDSGTNDLA